jgi:hypothetical protein
VVWRERRRRRGEGLRSENLSYINGKVKSAGETEGDERGRKSKEPAGRRRYENQSGGRADESGLAVAGTACCAPTGYCYGKARPGVESGSKLPHSTESW